MKRERYIHADFTKASPPKEPAPVSAAFPITWTVENGDLQAMWAETLENLCYLTRMSWGALRQNRPLGGVAHMVPALAGKALSDLSAAELVTLVERLREDAERARAGTDTGIT